MSAQPASFPRKRLRAGIPALASAVFLVGAIQSLIFAAEEPLRPAVIAAINFLIVLGRFDVLHLSDTEAMWSAAVWNLFFSIVSLGISMAIANSMDSRPARTGFPQKAP